jgi:hypothetical protein
MPPLPPLPNWEATRDSLHQAALIIENIRRAMVKPEVNSRHPGLQVTPFGLSTGLLPDYSELALDFDIGAIRYRPLDGEEVYVPLSGHDQRSVTLALLKVMSSSKTLNTMFQTDQLFLMEVDTALAADYAHALFVISEALQRFQKRLPGASTPLSVSPQTFDLSFSWFGSNPPDANNQPHISFGFAPYGNNQPRPYLFVSPWPVPVGLEYEPLPEPGHWHTEGWIGAVVDYDAIGPAEQPEKVVESLLVKMYRVIAPRTQCFSS